MIRSMTAFSRAEGPTENGLLICELRSVNHRFSEVSLRLPEELRPLEAKVRERLAARLARGKIDAALRLQPAPSAQPALEIDRVVAAGLVAAAREVDRLLEHPAAISAIEVLRWPGVIQARGQNPERLAQDALTVVEAALKQLLDSRAREGERLKVLIQQRLAAIEAQLARVRSQLPAIQQGLRSRLQARVAELRAELDPARLEQEVALLVTKADVDEELDRLTAHVSEVRRVLEQDEPVGRRLDFLMQELNREANTLGAKSVHLDTTGAAVDLKVLIEQMREQIQNIE